MNIVIVYSVQSIKEVNIYNNWEESLVLNIFFCKKYNLKFHTEISKQPSLQGYGCMMVALQIRGRNKILIFLLSNLNVCCEYTKEPLNKTVLLCI